MNKIEKLNIKLIGEYINLRTETLHQCECSNIWNVRPSNVLQGKRCGCKLKPNCKRYLEKLSKTTNVKLIGEYTGSKNKTLHQCECGNEWLAEPRNILSGKRCGCRKLLHEEELYKDKPTVLYYIKIGELYKIGIAMMQKSKDEISAVEARYNKDVKLGLEYTILDYKLYKNGYTAYKKEQQILMDNINNRYIGEKILIGGNTELFDINILSNTKL